MHISLNIAGTGLPGLETGLILPWQVSGPGVSGDGSEGTTLVADTTDTWTYDGAAATVSQREYRLLIDGAQVVPPQAPPSVEVPANTAGGAYQVQLRVQVTAAPGVWSTWQVIASGVVATDPELTAPFADAVGETGYTGSVTTDTGTGTLYWMVTTSPTPPAISALKAAESQPITAAGVQTVGNGGLTADTGYHIHFLQEDGNGRDSAIASSGAFTTNAPLINEPAAFGPGDWSITDLASGGDARLTITNLPDDGGAAFKAIFYRLDDGPWTPFPGLTPGSLDLIDLFTDGIATEVRLQAENLVGFGPVSAPKTVTTTTVDPQAWLISDLGDGRFTLSTAPPPAAMPTITNNGDGTFAVLG